MDLGSVGKPQTLWYPCVLVTHHHHHHHHFIKLRRLQKLAADEDDVDLLLTNS